ncbi:hypothetical protein NQZ68_038472 [Dissostichus eleginoides]|nr:hypothetical protein NQZ68_038472 [Dissostichus eleginoides]
MALVSEFLGELTLSYGGVSLPTPTLEALLLGLMKSTAQYDASELKASMKGLGTDEETLIEMVCSRNNEELLEIKRVYREMFKKELDKEVAGDTSGDFAKLLLALVQTKRDEPSNVVDYEKIDEDARVMFERYKSYSPYDMKESIRKEVKGDLENPSSLWSKGAKEKVVTRIMVSRCEVDLMKIQEDAQENSVPDHRCEYLCEHTKGDYQKALLSLCGGDD